MFLNISLKSKGSWIIIVSIITVIIFLTGIVLMLNNIDKMQNGNVFTKKIDLSFSNYYVSYDMTVISNKNINTYNVKEWHKEGEITKLEYLDYMKNLVTITLQGDTCNILNNGNTAKLVVNNMLGNRNISSLSTFGYLYNLKCEECNCIKEKYIKEDEVTVRIELKGGTKCNCDKLADELNISYLELIIKDGVPKNYIVYDKNKKEYISIVYNVYETNIQI